MKTETELEKKKNKSFETDLFNALIKNRKKISTLWFESIQFEKIPPNFLLSLKK